MFIQFSSLDAPSLVHAVTTRQGGVSLPPFDTLDMSFSRSDDDAAVRENRRRVFQALEIEPTRVVMAGHNHGNRVLVVNDQHAGCGALDYDSMIMPPADAMITNTLDLYLMACFGDCVPLLFVDPVQHTVGIAHAGWQGTVKQIGAHTVRAMQHTFGTQPGDVRVGIGPSAGPCCYNVRPAVVEAVQSAFPDDPHILLARDDDTIFDLWAANVATLMGCGVPRTNIENSQLCTICHSDRFFSHRAHKGHTGRIAAIVGLRSPA